MGGRAGARVEHWRALGIFAIGGVGGNGGYLLQGRFPFASAGKNF